MKVSDTHEKCSNEYCAELAKLHLVNGSEVEPLCKDCFIKSVGEMVTENDGRITFQWNEEHDIADVGR